MKALHVIQRYYPAQLSGSEKSIAVLCQSLAKGAGHDISVVTSNVGPGEGFYDPRSPRLPKSSELIDGVQVYRLPVNWVYSSVLYILNRFLPAVNASWRNWLAIQAFGPQLVGLEGAIVSLKPDIIHVAPMPMSHVYATWQIARKYKLPLVITPAMHFEDPKFNNPLILTILKDAGSIITHSQFESDELVRQGLPAHRMTSIPATYLEQADFTSGSAQAFRDQLKLKDEPIVLFIGSKSYDKGTTHLLSAWDIVQKKVPTAHLVIAGSSTSSWNEAKKSHDLSRITELDYVDEDTKHSALAGCDILCIPSRSESFGMILLEAWAKGKPVVGGPAGATRELVSEGEDGYTVEFGDVTQLSERLIELLEDTKKQAAFGQAGMKKAKQFTEDEIVKKTLRAYAAAIKSI